jgi:uncharacterized protein
MNDDFEQLCAAAYSPKILNIILFPTEQCNFRCKYCYEDFRIGRMESDVVGGIKKLLLNRISELSHLNISWFGGEPLLAQDIVFEILEYAKEIIGNRSIHFTSDMTTNGYLLSSDIFKRLIMAGVNNYQISLDGISETHDTLRTLHNGGGTFKQIWTNLIKMKTCHYEFSVILRIHISHLTIPVLSDLLSMVKAEFGGDHRFKIFLKEIHDWGGLNSGNIDTINEVQATIIKDQIIDNHKNVSNLQKHHICYASKANSYVIRANGRINKCTVALNQSTNDIGELLSNGQMKLDSEKAKKWLIGFERKDISILGCPQKEINSKYIVK